MREIKVRAWNGNKIIEWDWIVAMGMVANVLSRNNGHYEVMQYTGLKDKNGTEIYEGDILSKEPLLKIVFENGGFCFSNHLSSGSDRLSQDRVGRLEVIGNIYEHPHLVNSITNP